jgi:GNAT superfamily N-acetyltransferase
MAEKFKIRLVDTGDEYIRDALAEMHDETFENTAPIPNFDVGDWWLVANGRELVGFCGLTPSTYRPNTGYLKRAAVREGYRGHGLQRRMLTVRERHARSLGYDTLYTDTATFNYRSSNNLFRAGFELFRPDPIWNGEDFLYWRKHCA